METNQVRSRKRSVQCGHLIAWSKWAIKPQGLDYVPSKCLISPQETGRLRLLRIIRNGG